MPSNVEIGVRGTNTYVPRDGAITTLTGTPPTWPPAGNSPGEVDSYIDAYNGAYLFVKVGKISAAITPTPDYSKEPMSYWNNQGRLDALAGKPNRSGMDLTANSTPDGSAGTVVHADGTTTSFNTAPIPPLTPAPAAAGAGGGGFFGNILGLLGLQQLFSRGGQSQQPPAKKHKKKKIIIVHDGGTGGTKTSF